MNTNESAIAPLVAPHVAAVIRRYARGNASIVAQLTSSLNADQLAGRAFLPDPLPATSRMKSAVALKGLSAAERRLLLIATLSVTDHAAILLAAAAVGIESILDGPIAMMLDFAGGRFRVRDDRLRSVVASSATVGERAEAHWALARSLRVDGQPSVAVWHGALGDRHALEGRGPVLIQLAERRVEHGDFAFAFEISRVAATVSKGDQLVRARLVAANAALWCGWTADADEQLGRVKVTGSGEYADWARKLIRAVDILKDGPSESLGLKARIIEQMQPLADIAMTRMDRTAMTRLLEISAVFQEGDYKEADAIEARLILGAVPALTRWPWSAERALSPLAEAHVRLQQTAFQLQAQDTPRAAATLADAITRLPLASAGAGIVSSYVRLIAPSAATIDPTLADIFDALAPRRQLSYEIFGFSMGEHSAAASIRVAAKAAPAGQHDTPWGALLSTREREVAHMVTRGHSNREIAETLALSVRTIEVHLANVFRKLAVHSRTELVSQALRPRLAAD